MNRKERRAAQKRGDARGLDLSAPPAGPSADLFAAAVRHFHAGQMGLAERGCREALLFDPDHIDALHMLGIIATRAGRSDAAVELLSKAIALNGRSPDCHFHLGCALAAQGSLDEAIARFKRALGLNPTFATAAFYLANALRERGQLDEAATQYRRTLALQPDYPAAHYKLAAVLARQGSLDDAVVQYRHALRLEPSSNEVLNDFAIATERQGKWDDALAIYQRALSLKPDAAAVHYNVGRLLHQMGQFDQAILHLERALVLQPDFIEAHNNLSGALRKRGQHMEAVACLERALPLDPDHTDTLMNICSTLYELNLADHEAAARHARRLLETHGHNPLIRRGLSGLVGADFDDSHDLEYSRALFDEFSVTFDQTLGALGYNPRPLAAALAIDESQGRAFDILDAGCGTGLCGALLKPVARSLTGVDISPAMLDKARDLAVYDRLVSGDAVEFMSRTPEAFHLVIAADVLTYVGDVPRFLQAANRALRPDGRLAVSTENLDQEGQTEGYRLAPSGRYKHSRHYLMQAFCDAGFVVETIAEGSFRQEADRTIRAWIVVGQKRQTSA